MAEELEKEPEYIQISIQLLTRLKKELLFDVYVKRSEGKFTRLLKKSDEVDLKRIQSYVEKGIEFFFITDTDYAEYNRYLDVLGQKYLTTNPNKKTMTDSLMVLRELVQASIIDIQNSHEISPEQVGRAELVVKSCVNNLNQNPQAMLRIIKSMAKYDYIYRHTIMTSIFTVMLAKADGIVNPQTLNNIGLGAFLHDIGVTQLNFNPEECDQLSGEQRKEMERHPEIGKRMLDAVKGVRDEVLYIIMQHHEQPNGRGYPNNLRGKIIYRPALMVSIADSFSALVSKRPYREAVSAADAIRIMRSDEGKFDRKLLEKFAVMVLGKPQE